MWFEKGPRLCRNREVSVSHGPGERLRESEWGHQFGIKTGGKVRKEEGKICTWSVLTVTLIC